MNVRQLPTGWSTLPLNDLRAAGDHTLVGGPFGSDLTTRDYITDGGVPVIRGTNLGGNESRFVDNGFVFVSHHKAEKLRRNMAYPGDVVFTQRGTLGQVAVIPFDSRFKEYVISQSQMKLTPNLNKIDSRYLYYYFRSPHALRRLLQETQATGVPHINLGILKRFPVVLPPLSEQKRIAEILDRAEALRAKRRAALALLDELTQSIFLDMFGDPVSNPKDFSIEKLSGFIQMVGGYAFKSKDYVAQGIPLVKIGEVNRGRIAPDSASYLPASYLKQYARFIAKPGDMLMSLTGTTGKEDYANLLLLDDSFKKYFVNQRVAFIKPNAKLMNRTFLLHMLRIPEIKSRITSKSRGIRQANISNGDVLDLEIPVPPIEMQLEFDSCVSSIEGIKVSMGQTCIGNDQLFASLQHRAFRGEL